MEDDEDHQIKSVKFTDEEGAVFGPYTKMSSIHDGINLKTINFPLGEKTPFDEVSHILSNAKHLQSKNFIGIFEIISLLVFIDCWKK